MAKYELIYTTPDGYDEADVFDGCWYELNDFIKSLKEDGFYNISAACICDECDEIS